MGRGELLVLSVGLVWPVTAGLVAAARRASVPAVTVFLRTGLVAVGAAALLAGWAYVLIATNGTSRAMASLGPQIGALLCLAGGVACGVVAGVLRMRR